MSAFLHRRLRRLETEGSGVGIGVARALEQARLRFQAMTTAEVNAEQIERLTALRTRAETCRLSDLEQRLLSAYERLIASRA